MVNNTNFFGSADFQLEDFNSQEKTDQVKTENPIRVIESGSLPSKRGRRPGAKVTQYNEETARITLNIPVSIIKWLDKKAIETNTTRTSVILEQLAIYKDNKTLIASEIDALKALLNGLDFADLPSSFQSNQAFFVKFASILPEKAVEQIISQPSFAQYIPKDILLQYAIRCPNAIAYLPKNIRKEALSAFERSIKDRWAAMDKEAES